MEVWNLFIYLILWEIFKIFFYSLQLPQKLVYFVFGIVLRMPIQQKLQQQVFDKNIKSEEILNKDGKQEVLNQQVLNQDFIIQGNKMDLIRNSSTSIVLIPSELNKCPPEIRIKTLALVMTEKMIDSIIPIIAVLLK